MIRALIFDFDGVIVNTAPMHRQLWREIFSEYGLNLSDEEIDKGSGRGRRDFIREILGGVHSEQKIDEIAEEKKRRVKEAIKVVPEPIPGVAQYLEYLKEQGYLLAIGSSSFAEKVHSISASLNIARFFDAVATGDDVPFAKPDPGVFLLAAERLGIDPSECVVFEDSIAGLTASQSAGMRSVFVMSSLSRSDVDPNLYEWAVPDFHGAEKSLPFSQYQLSPQGTRQ